MPRNGDEVHRRLQQAALELFLERGYDQTTAAEIAERAGVTERTYFRHFPDKRDILFDGDNRLRTMLTEAIVSQPASLDSMTTLRRAFDRLVTVFEANRSFSEPRQAVISVTPALREREISKQADLIAAAAAALAEKGEDPRTAAFAAQLGAAAFGHALMTWFADPGEGLSDHLDRAFEKMRLLSA